MLLLTRRPGLGLFSEITITTPTGDTITVSLIDVRGTQCRIGIAAPAAYNISRAELSFPSQMTAEPLLAKQS
jgi:sRNA-binding carbon storage regulator CsrA